MRTPPPRTEAAGGCQLDVSLVYEVVADDIMTLLLPINVMRNYALLQVGGGVGGDGARVFWKCSCVCACVHSCVRLCGCPEKPTILTDQIDRRRARGWWR